MTSTDYDDTFFEGQSARSAASARVVLSRLFEVYRPASVIDVGCGVGTWARAAKDLGVERVVGVDGSYVRKDMLHIPPEDFVPGDLENQPLVKILEGRDTARFDAAICLEVAEHLPFERAESFVDDLTGCTDLVLFSAAVPFQSGVNHVNEQWPEFWAILFRARGFACWDWLRDEIWTDRGVDWWYAQNTLVFAREGSDTAARLPTEARARTEGLARVHPENFLLNVLGQPRTYGPVALPEELGDMISLVRAYAQGAESLPDLKAVSRARAAPEGDHSVFPWTRTLRGSRAPEKGAGKTDGASSRAERFLQRFTPFSEDRYLAANPDVAAAGVLPSRHALKFGIAEGRTIFDKRQVAQALGRLPAVPRPELGPSGQIAPMGLIGVYCSSMSNIFMQDIAAEILRDLQAADLDVTLLDETAPRENRPETCLFVAPHEFFTLGQGKGWADDEIVASSFMLNTEQVQTPWFTRALPFLLGARGVVDICAKTAQLLETAGIEAETWYPRLVSNTDTLSEADRANPLFKVLPRSAKEVLDPGRALDARTIDLNFIGATTPFREQFFARSAGRLADYSTFIYCRKTATPLLAEDDGSSLTRLAKHVASHSKITLNIHRDELGYFEWHRIVGLGLSSGSVVVSDPCMEHPMFTPGTHHFEERARYIPDLIDWLLKSKDGQAAMLGARRAIDALFDGTSSPAEAALPILKLVSRTSGQAAGQGGPRDEHAG